MPQLKQHATIIIENDQRASKSRSATDFVYQLTQPIKFLKRSQNKQYFIRIENVRIPISFYNINATNNKMYFKHGTTSTSVEIPQGNYTIDDLDNELQSAMNEEFGNTAGVDGDAATADAYAITYNDIRQKVQIENKSGVALEIETGVNNLLKISGFTEGQTIANDASSYGTNIAYTNTMRHIKLQIPNLVSNNVYSNCTVGDSIQTQVQPVGLVVPITEIRNEFQFYSNHQGPLIKLSNQTTISDINVKLLDPNNQLVDLNDIPFGFELVFYEYNK